ncbi:MAG: hypothetical protein IT198_04620 [Acidimicrobiia bacterium]|nr:hypothetical protein [Acidimicrobiia bacterium]
MTQGQGARVHVAFGMHVDLHHSYRGDSPDTDGFGLDFDVIRASLDVLDAHPHVPCDWDIECAWALEERFPEYAPELLERIRTRVVQGPDSVRHMSWAGEMLAALTGDELRESLQRSWTTLGTVFGEEHVDAGCYSQECSYSPDMPRLLSAAGIEWLSLFYSATQFSAFRQDVRLVGAEAYNPLRLLTPEGDAAIVVLPTYHHGDLLDFSGLDGWARHIHATCEGDCLVYMSFDADAPTWPGVLASSIEALEPLDFTAFTLATDYVRAHPPRRDVTVHRDLCDGAMDGFDSWSEKPVNFRLFHAVQAARRRGGADMTTRLRAMKTTHFGLAVPFLHPDRERGVEDYIRRLGGRPEPRPPALDSPPPRVPGVSVLPGAPARFSEPEAFGDGGTSFWVETNFPAHHDGDDAEPCALGLAWNGPVTVHKENFRGYRSTWTVEDDTDSVNNALTPGWAAFSRPDGSGLLVAFDEDVLAAPAALPFRLRRGELRINPFGAYWGEYPDLHPEWTGASGLGAQILPAVAEHLHASGPAFAGETIRMRLGLVPYRSEDGTPPPVPAFDPPACEPDP